MQRLESRKMWFVLGKGTKVIGNLMSVVYICFVFVCLLVFIFVFLWCVVESKLFCLTFFLDGNFVFFGFSLIRKRIQ